MLTVDPHFYVHQYQAFRDIANFENWVHGEFKCISKLTQACIPMKDLQKMCINLGDKSMQIQNHLQSPDFQEFHFLDDTGNRSGLPSWPYLTRPILPKSFDGSGSNIFRSRLWTRVH